MEVDGAWVTIPTPDPQLGVTQLIFLVTPAIEHCSPLYDFCQCHGLCAADPLLSSQLEVNQGLWQGSSCSWSLIEVTAVNTDLISQFSAFNLTLICTLVHYFLFFPIGFYLCMWYLKNGKWRREIDHELVISLVALLYETGDRSWKYYYAFVIINFLDSNWDKIRFRCFGIERKCEVGKQRQSYPEDNFVFCCEMTTDNYCHLVDISAGKLRTLIHEPTICKAISDPHLEELSSFVFSGQIIL